MNFDADPRLTVARGYDLIGDRYSSWAGESRDAVRTKYERVLIGGSPAGSGLLDLGCGNGIPTTRRLARHFHTTAVEISSLQAMRARSNLPTARVICADMTRLQFGPESFDAVSAFFSIIHVPRDEQGALVDSIAAWLRPGGVMVATMMSRSLDTGWEDDWLGAPMYWSGNGVEKNVGLIEGAGLMAESAEVESPDSESFLWVVARKPR
ncbi:MAG: class I SAM-dependent methyltransferase [Chloroflexi bacterium]|nr:class I SAM-dependent methyltransferase [Chloroflexota bacterium]